MDKFDIIDDDGNAIGAIPISPAQYDLLKKGIEIEIKFHTPQMLREKIPVRNGAFRVSERGGQFVASDVEQARSYIASRADIDG